MVVLDEAALAEIKRLYEGSALTLVEIGARFARTPSGISRLARTHGWVMRSVARGWAPRRQLLSGPKARALVAHRLCDAITKKLDQMETDMASGKYGPEDYERDAKSLAAMVGGLDKVAATAADADEEQQPKAAEPGAISDVERLQREIIERFACIQRRRNAEAGSG